MDLYELNRLIDKVTAIKRHLASNEMDPLLAESLGHYINIIHQKYGIYLNDLLFDVYDEYCEDNEIQKIEDYLSPTGVSVDVDDFPGIRYSLKLRAFPLRFEMENKDYGNHEVVWEAA